MDLFQSIILGVVQGFTEFLPVSSSGHLLMLQKLFGIGGEVPLFYDVMLHVGTLVAVIVVLRKELAAIILHPVKNKLGMLVLATIPAVVVTLVTEKLFPEVFADIFAGKYLAYGFFGTSIVLILSELITSRYQHHKHIGLKQAVSMGLMQSVAIIPGLSRSGSTIAGGLLSGGEREHVAKYAFLMSVPVILGSVAYTGMDVAKTGLPADISVLDIAVGTIAAALCGFLAIKFMLKLISKYRLYGFAIYTAALGAFVLTESLAFGVVF